MDVASTSLSVAAQVGQKTRISSLRTIIAEGNAQRLLLPDQHDQPLSPRDPGVNQVRLTHHANHKGIQHSD